MSRDPYERETSLMNTETTTVANGKAAKPAKSEAKEFWSGVISAKVDKARVDKALKEQKLSLPKGANTEDKVAALHELFSKLPQSDLVECDACKGPSPIALDTCPYCGEEEGVADVAVPEVTAEIVAEPVAPKAKTSKALAIATPVESQAMAPSAVEKELDTAVHEIRQINTKGGTLVYMLATKLKEICDAQTWKARRDSEGKVKYKTFDQFCMEELGFTSRYANDLMKIVASFTQKEVEAMGTAKLRLVLAAPADAQPAILENVRGGAGKTQIAREVKAANAASSTGNKKTPPPASDKDKKVTVALFQARQTVALYKKAAAKTPVKDLVRAKRVSEEPWGTLALDNDTTLKFTVTTTASGELKLIVEAKRNEK